MSGILASPVHRPAIIVRLRIWRYCRPASPVHRVRRSFQSFSVLSAAPFWILNLAAVNIQNETIREALGITGILLCVFGLLYGWFWRIQIRKRFNLSSYGFCCGKPAVTDFALWLCCCWCDLAQEVRTGNVYDIVEDELCLKQMEQLEMSPSSSCAQLPDSQGGQGSLLIVCISTQL